MTPVAVELTKRAGEELDRLWALSPAKAGRVAAKIQELGRIRPHPDRAPYGTVSGHFIVEHDGHRILYRDANPVRVLSVTAIR